MPKFSMLSTVPRAPLLTVRKQRGALATVTLFFVSIVLSVGVSLAQAPAPQRKASADDGSPAAQTAATSGRRVALLLANSKYVTSPLVNPKNDLALMEKTLRALNFQIIGGEASGKDLRSAEMSERLSEFEAAARGAHTALVFYAGHGEEFGADTYLLDTSYAFVGYNSISKQSLTLTEIYAAIDRARAPFNFVFIDACRTLPGKRNDVDRSFSNPKDPANTITVFSTGKGTAANDGVGAANSPFTTVLAEQIAKPGQVWDETFRVISREVKRVTKQAQQPKKCGDFDEPTYYFNFQGPTTVNVQATTTRADAVELAFWQSTERQDSVAAYEIYVKRYPKGAFIDLVPAAIARLKAVVAANASSAGTAAAPPVVAPIVQAASVLPPVVVAAAPALQPAAVVVTLAAPTAPRPGEVFKDCAVCPELVVIPGGEFTMGGDDHHDGTPPHRVRIKSFALGKTEITQGQWKAVIGRNPSTFTDCGDTCPVERVSWHDAQDYIKKLNAETGQRYRLPSESEWEYAARGGLARNTGGGMLPATSMRTMGRTGVAEA